ncbi:MAG: hypothetical protein GW917_03050 [Bdellovibrionales bacterium]|nr:hypothetical protein [Bdellovibrionales bacterium]
MNGYGAPPQAYTRDTLVKAIDWIAEQPENMRAQATNADALVSLYLQHKRRNKGMDSYPVSGEAFTQDLKTLAKDLEQFSAPQAEPTPSSSSNTAPSSASQTSGFDSNSTQRASAPKTTPPQQHQTTSAAGPTPKDRRPPIEQSFTAAQWAVDPRSWAQAIALQKRLNLSSEAEALRMMIALGHEQLSKLLP